MQLEVTVSGTVGKQTFATDRQAVLKGLTITPSAANCTVKIRDGNASGEVVFYAVVPSAAPRRSSYFDANHKFNKGMHVKVIGASNVVYLNLEG
jgi:hypothetical protein